MVVKDKDKLRQIKADSQRRRRVLLKLKAIEYLKDNPCVDCGELDYIVLDFDHRDQKEKYMPIALMINNRMPWEKIQAEILKCDVRCANCHRRRTYEQLGHWKDIVL